MIHVVLVALAGAGAAITSEASEATRAELYTMGPGDDVFEAFGHSALCITDEAHPRGVCYNYGTSDFSDPPKLIWEVLRGRARFWVSRMPLPLMLQAYTEDDRSIYRQKLDLSPEAAAALAARLENDMRPEHRYYTYHHYRENCSTRLRDHLDAVSGGLLRTGANVPAPETYRELTLRGFSRNIWLLVGMEIVVGRAVDAHPTVWDTMFLPTMLRAEVAKKFAAPPEVLYTRRGPLPALSPHAGRGAVWAAALALTILCAGASLLRSAAAFRFALVVTGLVLGLLALLADGAAAVALLPELRRNEVLLVLLPTDLGLIFFSGRTLFTYLAARLLLAAVVALGLVVGALVQPMWAIFALAAAPLAVCAVRSYIDTQRHLM